MAEITFDGLNENSLIMQWNTDNYGNPKSIHINNEVQQVSATHHVIQLAQIPDEYYRARFVAEGINGWLIEVRNLRELKNINNYYVDYNHGIVYFHEEMAGRLVRADYYGRGVMFLSDTRIFHKSGDSFATTLDEVLEKSEDAFKLLESTGGLNQAIELLEDKAEEGNKVADRLENFITETQFYGYTIVLSREAFVVRAKEDGNLHNGEMEDLTVDVVVYKGAKNLSAPDLDVRLYSTTNCECEIENQKLTVTRIDVDCIQAQAIIEIDCGDGLIAYRTIEVTKVFDGVSQFNVEMTNAFHSFSATHSGKIEEEQSVTCEFTVTKANEEFKGYVVGIQNVPSGITHNLEKPTENASSVTFTAQPGTSLPDNASISVVFQFNDYVVTKTFAFTKSKQGLSAKSLRLAGNQIIHYENPNYEGTPNPTRTSIIAQVTDLSGTPVWSYLEGEEWIVIDGQNGTSLNLYHNDRIWGTKHELTIKCELDGFSDEITLIKIANGAMGLSSYSVILSNESTTLRVGLDGKIPTEELTSQYTRVTAFKGADQITPTSITVPQGDTYEVSVSGSTINLIDVDTSTSTVNIPIEILLDNAVVVNKVWSIAKTEKGEIGAAGAVYSINVEGGTRAITYNQLNENPRPTFSGVFTAHIYENGNDITSQIKSWYWTTQGHFTGTSINSSFTPEIKDRFDESVLNNSVTVTAIYNHMPISYTVPIVVSKDLGGLDWVTDWDSTKVSIRDTEVLTPKLFAGEYNPNSDTINGVAIGTDVLNDGQVQGITGYQNNKVSFLLATDGSLLIGNPFEDNGTGLSYNHGRFVLNVDEMAIAGGTVPTWDDMEIQLEHHSKDIINAIQDNIDSMNESLNDMTTFVDTILQDELITTLEKVQLDALFQTVTQEVNNIQAQYDSVINNPYLVDEDVRNLEKCYVDYMNAYSNIVDVYNDVFGEPVVEEVEYTIPQEEYLMADDFILETVDVVEGDEVFDVNMEEQSVMLADENVDLNPFMLDTLTTQDGYIIVTKNGQPIQMVTENTLLDFSHAVDILREYSSILQQAISEALLSISENRASQMVEEAKEEVRAEIADVDSALNDLETTMNGSFKSGLIGEQSKAILNERLTQLSIEKKDVDGQYEVLSQNTVLSSSNKQTLGIAKDDLDAAHDLLVSKINQVIVDNLITNTELQAVNNLISEYANKLQAYSKVAQECNALIAQTYANAAVAAITDEDVFNKVTNYGVLQGLFLKDEKVYINSEYINTRNFKAVTDDGKETFKIDENGEVSITAKSLAITGSSNLATQDYVNTQIENLTNTNITFTLSNEFQIIPTDESYYPLSEGTYSIKVTGYKGSSQEITDFTIGTVTSNDAGIVAVVSNINKTIVLSVSPDAPLGDSNGYVDIPISYDGRDFNKRWSWAVSKQGNQATTVTITGEQFFKYTNNYTGTPTPSQIVLTANVFNSTETGKWQYNDNGTWVDWKDADGNVITDKNITIKHTSPTLYATNSVFLRYYVDSVFDTYTVARISDGASGTSGKGISTVVNKYLATNLSTGVTSSTNGWTTTVQEINADKQYLWNYEIVTYTDNSTTETTPCVIGRYGTSGRGISQIIEYYLVSNYTRPQDVLLADGWSTTMKTPTKDAKYLWNYTRTEYTDGLIEEHSPIIIGNFAEDGATGGDAYTVLLTNENHTFVANHLGATTEQIVYSDVIAYKGATPITPTIGTLPTVTGLTLAKSGVRITIKSNAGTSLADTGSFDIPITVDGQTFTKTFSWTKVKDGQAGASGANAKSVNIMASNMVFKSTDGGTTFSPNNIKLTAQYQNLTHSRWQYSVDGGTTWANVYDGDNGGWQGGITATSDSLTITIPKTCTFFTDTVTSIVFKVISTDASFYDVITITKLHDVTDLEVGGTNLVINSDFFMGKRTNWTYAGAWTIHATEKYKDKYIIYSSRTGLTSDSWAELRSNKIEVNEGETFTMSVDVKWTDIPTTEKCTIAIWGYDDNGENRQSLIEKRLDGSQDWDRVVITGTVPTGVTHVRACISHKRNGSIYATNFKLERGNVATDWSPAPQDTTTEIDNKVNTLDTSLNQKAIFNRLTNNGTSQGIYLEDGQLYINGEYIEANSIKVDQLEVGSITMFVEDKVQTGIDNTNIGARNYLVNTGTPFTMTGSNTTNQTSTMYHFVNKDNSPIIGGEATFSCKYEISEGSTGSFRIQTNGVKSGSATEGKWFSYGEFDDVTTIDKQGEIVFTREYKDTHLNTFNGISLRLDNFVGSITITECSMVVGNKSVWTPAPEDTSQEIQDKVDNLNNSLNQNEIFSRLTNNGQSQGIFLENGELYVNGEFINSKNFSSVDNSGNQTFLIDSNGNVHINANTFSLGGKGVPTSQEVLDMINEYGQAENLLLKPNFNDGSLTNWNYSVSSYLSVDTSRKHEDSTSLKLNYTGSSNAVMVATSAMSITKYEAGKTYKAGMWIYVEDKTKLKGNLVFSASGVPAGSTSSTIIDSITLTNTNLVNNKWIQFTFDFVPTVDHTSPSIRINCSSGVVAWVTDFTLQEQGGMSQQQMVDILNGAGDGLYLVDGKLLMNAEYIQTGTLAANLIQVRVDETTNLLPFNYVTMDNAINDDDFYISKDVNGIPIAECDLPIYGGGGGVDCAIIPLGYSNVTVKSGKSYWFSCEYYAYWGNDTKPDDGVGTSTATSGSKVGLGTGDNLNIVLYKGTDVSNMNTDGYIELASVEDFNASINIVEREDYAGVYTRTWTRLVGRIDNPTNYSGKLYVHLDCSGFEAGDYGYFYLRNLQLTDASVADESISLDYITQVKEKRIELTDSSSYYSNILSVDGISLKNGVMSANYDYAGTSYIIDQDGFRYNVIDGSSVFSGESTSYYSYDGGSSGMITGYDTIFGIGGVKRVGGNREGIFIGVHDGFQIPNSTEYGRADIYVHANYSTALDDYSDWELLGARVEPNGLVRRDGNSNITTNNILHFTGQGIIRDKNNEFAYQITSSTGHRWYNMVVVDSGGVSEMGKYIDFHTSHADTSDYSQRLASWDIGLALVGSFMPSTNNTYTLGDGTYRWKSVHAVNGTIQTSDGRYKYILEDISSETCYNFIKNTNLYGYSTLNKRIDEYNDTAEISDELQVSSNDDVNLHMGIVAQEIEDNELAKYILIKENLQDEKGNKTGEHIFGIDNYAYTTAVHGGLQEEIKVRDEQYEELKKENEDLKARLDRLEQLILKGE